MRNETLLFDSVSSPIPSIRKDLQVIPIEDNGRELLYFHDSMGYASPNFALDRQVEPVLSLITGNYSISQIIKLLNGSMDEENLLEFVQLLDQHRLLETKHFQVFSNRIEKDFEKADVRRSSLAGESYPNDPGQISHYLNELFTDTPVNKSKNIKALFAPHIDLRVGEKQYSEAFSKIKHLTPKRVVILATSHYAGYYGNYYQSKPFIGTSKEFKIPGKSFSADKEYISKLAAEETNSDFTIQDRAHRIEHSIEIHLLFLSHIWKHQFNIVPILVGGIDELFYHDSGEQSSQIKNFTRKISQLDDEDTFYLISGDLSHVGRKFGDPLPASKLRSDVEKIDNQFINAAVEGKAKSVLNSISEHYDETRICGFPPLYTFLNCFADLNGELLNYHWWDESERESAVSFGSILFGK